MKLPFVANGESKIRRSPETQAQLRALQAAIAARHADALISANFAGRCRLRCRMALEYWRERRRIVPSPHSLYSVFPQPAART